MSYNNFEYQDCISISESLEKNQSIYGFHFDGNYGYYLNIKRIVDSNGFLKFDGL